MPRPAVVAGSFYPADPAELTAQINSFWPSPAPQTQAYLAAMVPHAGYVYSGPAAAQVYARLQPADTYILLGPNHTGRGEALAVASDQAWETPLGQVPVDAALAQAVLKHCPQARQDDRAHRQEHSLEVQLPILQRAGLPFSVVCIALGTLDWVRLQALGKALATAIRETSRRSVILASSDMNHFENEARTRKLDQMALERVQALDPEGLLQVVLGHDISMCGAGPAAAMLTAALALGATTAEVVSYDTSAKVSGDANRVVGYAGVVVK